MIEIYNQPAHKKQTIMPSIFNYFIFTFTLYGCALGKIGDLTVHKTSPLVLNKWQLVQCKELLPHALSCDKAYKEVEDYCQTYAKKIDKDCDESYAKLKESCNKAENKIKNDCKESNGYVTAKCGRNFDRLEKVCRIASETISRSCTAQYKKMDNVCNKKYGKNDLKCNRIYEEYKDMCESNLEENVWYDKNVAQSEKLDEIEKTVEEIKEAGNLDQDDEEQILKKAPLHESVKESKPLERSLEETEGEYEVVEREILKPSKKFNFQMQSNEKKINEEKKKPLSIDLNNQDDLQKGSENFESKPTMTQKEVPKPSIKSNIQQTFVNNQKPIEKKTPVSLNENEEKYIEKVYEDFEPEPTMIQKEVPKPSEKSNVQKSFFNKQKPIEKKNTVSVNEYKEKASEYKEKASEDFKAEPNMVQKEVSKPFLKSNVQKSFKNSQKGVEKKTPMSVNENKEKYVEKSSEGFQEEPTMIQKEVPKPSIKSSKPQLVLKNLKPIEKKVAASVKENNQKNIEKSSEDFEQKPTMLQKELSKPSIKSKLQRLYLKNPKAIEKKILLALNKNNKKYANEDTLNPSQKETLRKIREELNISPQAANKKYLEGLNKQRKMYAETLRKKNSQLLPTTKDLKNKLFDFMKRERYFIKKVSKPDVKEQKKETKLTPLKKVTSFTLKGNKEKGIQRPSSAARKQMPISSAKSFMDKLYKEFDLEHKNFD